MDLTVLLSASIQWGKVGIVLGLIAGIAILLAVAILIVTKVCHITEDEKVLNVSIDNPLDTVGCGAGVTELGAFASNAL